MTMVAAQANTNAFMTIPDKSRQAGKLYDGHLRKQQEFEGIRCGSAGVRYRVDSLGKTKERSSKS